MHVLSPSVASVSEKTLASPVASFGFRSHSQRRAQSAGGERSLPPARVFSRVGTECGFIMFNMYFAYKILTPRAVSFEVSRSR